MNGLIITLIVVFLLYVFFLWFFNYYRKKSVSKEDKIYFQKHWEVILKENDGRHQIVFADKLLDQMLARKGMIGSLGDKLKKRAKTFSKINDLWHAHRLRNKIAHEVGFSLSDSEKKASVKAQEICVNCVFCFDGTLFLISCLDPGERGTARED